MISFEVAESLTLQIIKVNVIEENIELGYFLFVPHSVELWEIHTHMNPKAFGRVSEIGKQVLVWFYEVNPTARVILTKIPSHNKLAKKLALSCKFKTCGEIPQTFLQEDKLISQELYYHKKDF